APSDHHHHLPLLLLCFCVKPYIIKMAQRLKYTEDQLAELSLERSAASLQEYEIHGKVLYNSTTKAETFDILVPELSLEKSAASLKEYEIHGKVLYNSTTKAETFDILVPEVGRHFVGTVTNVWTAGQAPETDIHGNIQVQGSIEPGP
ncbi:hypothetical protein GOP47_0005623, partial [Adiantum capillus-veneris]